MLILGIETSCDETSASVVKNGQHILSNVVSSSLRYHRKFGGVIPEIATRHHVENIDLVIRRSLYSAGANIKDIDAIAVTQGPGLIGALLSGISAAKTIAYARAIPLIAVDHVKAHIYAAFMTGNTPRFPFIGLVVSGGHTRIYLVKDFNEFVILGDTLDDAVGEAYDKVAKILGLGYPGGPVIDKLAKKGDRNAIRFTCKAVRGGLDFSFSGIKTAVLYYDRSQVAGRRSQVMKQKANIAASFQEAVSKVIVSNTLRAMEKYRINTLVVGGGVSANSRLREMFLNEALIKNFNVYFPEFDLCSDNAAMIAGLGYRLYRKKILSDLEITAMV